jgi:exodeoxyribonuclease V alpha subunit
MSVTGTPAHAPMEASRWIDLAHERDLIDAADRRLLHSLRRLNAGASPADDLAFAVIGITLCRACAEGSLCLSLVPEQLTESVRGLLAAANRVAGDEDAAALAARFLQSAEEGRFSATLGSSSFPRPLVRAHGRLYLHRFHFAERTVARGLRSLSRNASPFSPEIVERILRETLEVRPLRAPDGEALRLTELQREALRVSLREPVFVLSGGPGTGKTTWTAAWLRAILRLPGVAPERVRLCAPTGRAARRLEESLRARLDASDADPVDAGAHAVSVTTLHALLGYRAFEGQFARGPEDPIDADWILLDEASMADVFLMASLVRALRPGTHLVLAGDPDQLPAVEAGSVLAELLPEKSANAAAFIPGPVPSVTLDTGHRARGAVAALAQAVRTGDVDAVLEVSGSPLTAEWAYGTAATVARIEPGEEGTAGRADLLRAYARFVFGAAIPGETGYSALLNRFRILPREEETGALAALWARVGRARVLAPLRRGPVSAEGANGVLRELLEAEWRRPSDGRGAGFHGAPILVTRNDDRSGLSNGDVGLWLETAEGAAVFFPRPDHDGGWLRLPVALLPPHELGFASTVHKSQGSEYDHVLLMLPEAENRLLSRETLYTGITRAKKSVVVYSGEAALREAVLNPLRRASGLRDGFAFGETDPDYG